MAKGLNLRAIFSADTAGIEKGSKRATQAIKAFDKESTSLFQKFGQLVGINTGKLGQMASAIEGFGVKTATSAGKSAESVAKLSKVFRGLGGVVAGVAAVGTAAWNALSREAEYYGTRLDGLGENAGLKAYQQTLKALRHDHRDGAGVQNFVNSIRRGWSRIATYFQAVLQSGGNADAFMAQYTGDISKAEEASELAEKGVGITQSELDNRIRIAELDAQIAEARRKINDTDLSILERQYAANSLAGLINDKAEKQTSILQAQLDNVRAMNALAQNGLEDKEAEVNLEVQLYQTEKNREMELRSIQRQQARLARETGAWLKSFDDLAMSDALESLEGIDLEIDNQILADIEALGPVLDAEIAELSANLQPVEIQVDPLPLAKVMDLLPALEQGFKQTFENIGTYIGDGLTNGDWAASNLAEMMLSTLGDMAIKVGELAISTGVALSGIKASLESMNPYLAIAAGAALVALGAAVKAGAANIAAGGGYSSASMSSSYGGNSVVDNYYTREISVNVTGTLVANGSQLMAVLNNENKRKSLTT